MPENTATIGFEKQIWDAASILRGNLDASEYKHVVLGLIFLKYLSDRFDARRDELVAEGEGFEEDPDAYTEENVFFVPQEARWEHVADAAHTPEIGKVIDGAMLAIEKENPRLKGILPKTFARPELDKRRLGDVVDLFTNIRMKEHGDTRDILGRTYEYCLSMFAEHIIVEPLAFAYNPAHVNIGSVGMNDMGYPGCVSPVYVVFSAEKDYHHFINFLIKRPFFREEIKTRASGSVRQSLAYRDFGLIKTVYPPRSVIEQFNKIYEPILAVIKHNQNEIVKLREIRDTLLPKLMSGDIDLSFCNKEQNK